MRQYVSCLTEAMPHAWMMRNSAWDNGAGGNNMRDQFSPKAAASMNARPFRYWTRRIHFLEKQRPRSKQAGIFRYKIAGGVHAFA